MVNYFYNNNIRFWDLIMQIGYNGYNLIKKLDGDSRVNRVNIKGKIYDPIKIKIVMDALKDTPVKILNLHNNEMDHYAAQSLAQGLQYTNITVLNLYNSKIGSVGAKYLADNLKDTYITHLCIAANNIEDEGVKHLAECLKNTNIISLDIANNSIKSNGVQYLAEALQYNIISLNLGNDGIYGYLNQIADEGVKYLSEHLKYTNVTNLNLDSNNISNHGVKYLIEHLQSSCITALSLKGNNIDNNGIQDLIQIIQDTTIITLDIGYINIAPSLKTRMDEAISQHKTSASKIQDIFKALVVQNTHTYDLEFTIPNENVDIVEYVYIMQVMNDYPNSKGYIFNMINQNGCADYPDIINNINEFIATMPNKFNTLINSKLSDLVESFSSSNYVNLVQQFEDMKLSEVVQNLLLHRVLYYVDDNQEILHPYIYKMLDKYNMPLYNEQLEPNKKEDIIAYYQDHRDIDGAAEIIDLLGIENPSIA